MYVCKKHVKDGLGIFETPHIIQNKYQHCCYFCEEPSKYKLFYEIPMSLKYIKKEKSII